MAKTERLVCGEGETSLRRKEQTDRYPDGQTDERSQRSHGQKTWLDRLVYRTNRQMVRRNLASRSYGLRTDGETDIVETDGQTDMSEISDEY